MKATTIVSAAVVIAVVGAMIVRGGKKNSPPPEAPKTPAPVVAALTPVVPVSPSTAPSKGLPGDSVALGAGTAGKSSGRGKAPKEVAPDAVALLQLSLARPRAAVGDTVLARLDASDDAGVPVTTSQIVWTTSNAAVVRFASPGKLLAVGVGKATITVTAGGTTASRELIVAAKKR